MVAMSTGMTALTVERDLPYLDISSEVPSPFCTCCCDPYPHGAYIVMEKKQSTIMKETRNEV